MTKKELLTQYAWSFLGTYYKWGGDDPSGFDCSGLICELLQAVGIIGRKEDYTAKGLWQLLKYGKVPIPQEGYLVFYGRDELHISHVAYCISDNYMIEAGGGGSLVKTAEDAIKYNAFIKIRPIKSRGDIIGYVKIA